ncbi:uncharacterized protein EI90DRAFT_3284602 [Cantharellus anzutake]|uniref:uncharacterized protein n=1 Tax=Cantharellus anzutake TaxID=1750568 RepID=UPI0019043DD0|nr:uncharacterized protein EI90DRAFT_3284602 [Cantharellus anzutake]KAF8344148.1 hypothetical protein EI90DRAFT_3284602 [Cantharellus anzutake]
MDTGSGKTFIAVMLTKWICVQPENDGKKVVFLVPKVPLVEQQATVFRNNTALSVKGYFGDLGVDNWDRTAWTAEFEKHEVLVMTPQILYNVLTHAHWSLDKVSLLIFDEVHHCQKRHPYAQIMADHYSRCSPDQRPKIFGLTASPIWNPKNPDKSLRMLEANTNARVVAVKQNSDELSAHTPRPREHRVSYARCAEPVPELWPGYETSWLWNETAEFLDSLDSFGDINRRLGKYQALFAALGPYAADYWVFVELKKAIDTKEVPDAALIELERRSSDEPYPSPARDDSGFRRAMEIYDRHAARFQDDQPFEVSWMSPKLIALIELLISARSETFQSIIFAEQRHIAAILAWAIQRIPETRDWIRCASLTGHGISSGRYAEQSGAGMHFKLQHEIVSQFRSGALNLIVATDVAEEGLDFQACNIIVRFDHLKTLVGYIQSRGRARRQDSVYVVMEEAHSGLSILGYGRMYSAENELKRRYRNRSPASALDDVDDGQVEEDDFNTTNEIYTIPSTGSTLTSYSSIPLLSTLCSMVKRDSFCPVFKPEWKVNCLSEGFFQAQVTLPSALPLDLKDRIFQGPIRRGKKSAKSSVAFIAMQRLCSLEIFDDRLLPGRLQEGDDAVDADGRGMAKTSDMPPELDVLLHDAFGNVWDPTGDGLWLHQLAYGECRLMGLVSCEQLTPFSNVFPTIGDSNVKVELAYSTKLTWDRNQEKEEAMRYMGRYTARLVAMSTGHQELDAKDLPFFLVPIDQLGVDYDAIRKLLEISPKCRPPFSVVPSADLALKIYGEMGHYFTLVAVRDDLSPLSLPPENSRERAYMSYKGFWEGRRRLPAEYIPDDQPLLELAQLKPHIRMSSTLHRVFPGHSSAPPVKEKIFFVPQSVCQSTTTPLHVYKLFRLLPAIVQHVNDLHRTRKLCHDLDLKGIDIPHLLEALTIPAAGANYSFQRLETMGDAVLKLATNVHVFNKYPYRHEGQLDILKSNSVNNRFLLSRAREIHLQTYLIAENIIPKWSPPESSRIVTDDKGQHFLSKKLNRKSMGDVMEALTGASFLCGGIDLALYTGTRLGLCFGGETPWPMRGYTLTGAQEDERRAGVLRPLEMSLGYSFKHRHLLLEALTHPTFAKNVSYQRLEFLGDEVIDLLVTQYLFLAYPEATPGQITWAKSRSVCNPTLATLSVRSLSLHKYMLSASSKLESSIRSYIEQSGNVPYAQLVVETWNYDPPKPLSDLFEAVIGAVFVDTSFDLERTFGVLRPLFADVLEVVGPKMPRDPITELMIWSARQGCIWIKFKRCRTNGESEGPYDAYAVYAHDTDITGPVKFNTLLLSKYQSASIAHIMLQDEDSPYHLLKICKCKELAQVEAQKYLSTNAVGNGTTVEVDQSNAEETPGEYLLQATIVKLDEDPISLAQGMPSDESTEGFALRSRVVARLYGDLGISVQDTGIDDEDHEPEILDEKMS